MWKIDPKDKYIHKYKHEHIYVNKWNIFVIVELFKGTRERRKRKSEREWAIPNYIASVGR
jgi:hypothetical protein